MKRENLFKILFPAAAGILVLTVVLLLLGQRETPERPQDTTAVTASRLPTGQTTLPMQTLLPTQTEQDTEPTTVPVQTTLPEETEPVPTEPVETEPPIFLPPTPTEPEMLTFPCRIPGTELVITQVSSYDGVFLEDGQDQQVSNACAIVVVNESDRDLEYAEITLQREDIPLEFRISGLTAGSSTLVLEYSAREYTDSSYADVSASTSMVDAFELSTQLVEVTEQEDGSLTVTNCSSEDIPCVRVFYKFYMKDMDVYVGGITYTAKLVDLAAGASQTIQPSHYLAGMSKIVMVKTYDTTQ